MQYVNRFKGTMCFPIWDLSPLTCLWLPTPFQWYWMQTWRTPPNFLLRRIWAPATILNSTIPGKLYFGLSFLFALMEFQAIATLTTYVASNHKYFLCFLSPNVCNSKRLLSHFPVLMKGHWPEYFLPMYIVWIFFPFIILCINLVNGWEAKHNGSLSWKLC